MRHLAVHRVPEDLLLQFPAHVPRRLRGLDTDPGLSSFLGAEDIDLRNPANLPGPEDIRRRVSVDFPSDSGGGGGDVTVDFPASGPLFAPPGGPAKPELDPVGKNTDTWLDFVKPLTRRKYLKSTDLGTLEYVSGYEPGSCSRNLSKGDHAFWHPNFEFNVPVHAVRVRLSRVQPSGHKETFWDLIFAGKPGDNFTIPSWSPPAGGNLIPFPQFCRPLPTDALYELRLTELSGAKNSKPRFDEIHLLGPDMQRKVWKVDAFGHKMVDSLGKPIWESLVTYRSHAETPRPEKMVAGRDGPVARTEEHTEWFNKFL